MDRMYLRGGLSLFTILSPTIVLIILEDQSDPALFFLLSVGMILYDKLTVCKNLYPQKQHNI